MPVTCLTAFIGNAFYLAEYRSLRVKRKAESEFIQYPGRAREAPPKPPDEESDRQRSEQRQQQMLRCVDAVGAERGSRYS